MTDLLIFTGEQVSRLTGLPVRVLRDWERTGLFARHFGSDNGRRPSRRLYSFRDLIELRALAELRQRLPRKELGKLAAWLREHGDTPLAELSVYLSDGKVEFTEPGSEPPPGAVRFELEPLAAELRRAVARLGERTPEEFGKIVRRRGVMGGDPVLAGTRIPTKAVWSFHEAGYDTPGILEQYPHLTEDDVRAAIAYEAARRRKRAG
jgi:uncharacterized protein (DUF433 family)